MIRDRKRGSTYLLHIDAMAGTGKDQRCLHRFGEAFRLHADLFLFFTWEVDEMVVLGADEERDGSLVEATPLAVPFLDGIEGRFAGEIKHEEDGDSIVADQRQHVDELPLAAEIPDGEGDFGVADRDGLLHEIDPFACKC